MELQRVYAKQVLFCAKLLFPRSFNSIKLPLFCAENHGLCFYRPFHWDLGSVRFLISDCFSVRAAVVKNTAAKRKSFLSLCPMASSSHEE